MDDVSATEATERIGPYRLVRQLGEGGMGVVHLGMDAEGREVAIKVLHPHVASDLKARDRLTREVETMRRVRSPRVAEVLDAQLTGPTPYIVTRFAPGRTLEQTVLEDGPLPDRDLVRLARGMCEALVAIHAADVIHRDLKPANVMLVTNHAGVREPLVIDFGIAHLVNATRLTQTGMFVGTPGYLAPEIIRDSEITQAADVHALAATVFFAATGKPPFGSGTFEAVCYNILEGKAQTDLAPAWLRGWLRLALAREAQGRPAAGSLLRLSRALDPSVTVFREQSAPPGTVLANGTAATTVLPDGTRVLADGTKLLTDGTKVLADGTKVLSDGTRLLTDGTKLLADGTRVPAPGAPGGTRVLPNGESFADLLPPVKYAPVERQRREAKPSRKDVPPPPGYYPPPPYVGQATPVDPRVAGTRPPAAAYPPQPVGPPAQARPYAPEAQAAKPRYRTAHPVLGAMLLAVLVAATVMLPVTVSLLAVVVVLCLRVGHYLMGGVAERRSLRGSSGADPLIVVAGTPWALVKSVLATAVQVPLAGMFGMCVWGGLYYLVNVETNRAAAYAAGAFVAGLFVLPGGGAPRKAVARTLTAVIRSPGAGMVATIAVGTAAFFAVMTAISAVPSWEPWQPPSTVIQGLIRDGKQSVMGLLGGLVGSLLDKLGLSFLTFWD